MKYFFTYCLLPFLFSCAEKASQVVMKTLNYPSASAVEYVNGKLYVMGDDATRLTVLDTDFNVVDSILIFNYPEKRIPKDIKPDIESVSLLKTGNDIRLLILGSGSLSPYRNTGWLINPYTKQTDSIRLDSLYQHFRYDSKIDEINIEGLCSVPTGILLANRGHLGYPANTLIFIDSFYYYNLNNAEVSESHKIKLENPQSDTSEFNGVSGLAYSVKSDKLFLTFSTEQTTSTYKDGAIGKSYLWIINNVSEKPFSDDFKPDKIIDLEKLDSRFRKQKIESVCLINENSGEYQLAMVADNDNGSSTIFKLSIKTN